MFQISSSLITKFQSKIKWLYQRYSIPRGIVFAMDSIAVFIVFLFAYLLRFNFELSGFDMIVAVHQALLVFAIYMLSSLLIGSYAGLLRYTTVEDITKVLLSTSYAFLVLLLISLLSRWIYWDANLIIPISILIIHYVSITVLLVFVRINVKIIYQMVTSSFREKKGVLVFGAGDMGITVSRVIQSDEKCNYRIAGFLDENKNLHGKHLNSIPVYNPRVLTPSFIKKNNLSAMIFAIKDMPAGKKSKMLSRALDIGLEVLEPPSVDTWLNGDFQIQQIHPLKLEDLLGRDSIQLNMKKIGMELSGKTILVTGAAGSIGSEIVRQLTCFDIGNLILIDQAETPMFHLENELRKGCSHCSVKLMLADITNFVKMEQVFSHYHPEIVFHAAAYKHVPVMEENPHEAIRVNVGGTKIITDLSICYRVKKFVMISTDKAVNPTNIMGASKRICEKIVQFQSQNSGNTGQFIVTRFGNVLGSNGSVIPVFRKQIEEGGPITVTHPEMTRYFMTITEACQLVLEAGFMGQGGEIFVFDMGKPVRIADLASRMIQLSGLVPDKDIKIVYTGLRPGEKLYEELFTGGETAMPTHHNKIKIARVEKLKKTDALEKIDELLNNLYSLSKQEVVDYCHDIVPEYKSTNDTYASAKEKLDSAKVN